MQQLAASLPPDAPDHFLINVLPDQVDGVRALIAREADADVPLYPMIRGRLVEVNGAPLDPAQFTDARARRLAEREFNLSWTAELPKANRVVAGRWWGAARGTGRGHLARGRHRRARWGSKLGDALTYDIAGTRVSAKITSLRKVDWNSFRPNFFALFAPGVLEAMPRTYLGAVRVPDAQRMPAAGSRRWCSSTRTCSRSTSARSSGQIQSIIDQVAKAVEFVFLFTLLGGLLVLQAAIAATQDERRFDAAILRTLGASQAQLGAAQLAEFLVLGALAGAARGGRRDRRRLLPRRPRVPDTVRGESAGVALRSRRRRGLRDARRVAGHARHRAAAAARSDPAAGLTGAAPPARARRLPQAAVARIERTRNPGGRGLGRRPRVSLRSTRATWWNWRPRRRRIPASAARRSRRSSRGRARLPSRIRRR